MPLDSAVALTDETDSGEEELASAWPSDRGIGDGGLAGIRIACFYPWAPFNPAGAWSRYVSLWRFLIEQGAEVTLAFMDHGADARLKSVSVSHSGTENPLNGVGKLASQLAGAKAKSELKGYAENELTFLLMYEKGLYLESHPRTGPWLDELVSKHDVVTCEYPMHAPLLSDYCKKWKRPLVVTSHDMLFELHGRHPGAKERLKHKELQSLRLADAVFFCNEPEAKAFTALGVRGTTVLSTSDVLGLPVGGEEASREAVRTAFKIRTAHYCLFVGSAHDPNIEAAGEIRRLAQSMPDLTFVVAGHCLPKSADGNFIAAGRISDEWLDRLYRGAFAVLVPLLRGTGISVKTFQALSYGKPVVSTRLGARGWAVEDGRQLLLVPQVTDFPAAIRRLQSTPDLPRQLGAAARAYAESLDYRCHFQPYADVIARLVPGKRPASAGRPTQTIVLADSDLGDQVGHHFNYAQALREQCLRRGQSFRALVKETALPEVLFALAAEGAFAQGAQDKAEINPYPADWGNLRSNYEFLHSNATFARELEAGLAKTARPFDQILLPNATPRQILGLALLLRKYPIYRTLQFCLILRYTTYHASGPLSDRKVERDEIAVEHYALALGKLLEPRLEGRIRLATDSAGLAKEYSALVKRPVEVWPIPHTLPSSAASKRGPVPSKAEGKIRIVYLGDAREEKGFELLPQVIRACAADPSLPPVEFVFQAFVSSHHHRKMKLVIEELKRLNLPQLHLIATSLGPDDYRALLESADLVLLPYDAATYRSRTSGPFVEAVCADKPVIIPRESWLSDQLGDSAAGETFLSGCGPDLLRALRAVLSGLPARTRAAAELGRQFRAYHNPDSFLDHLRGEPRRRPDPSAN